MPKKSTIENVPLGSIFVGKKPFSADKDRYLKMQDLDGDSWVVNLTDFTCSSIPEDCFDLEVKVVGKLLGP